MHNISISYSLPTCRLLCTTFLSDRQTTHSIVHRAGTFDLEPHRSRKLQATDNQTQRLTTTRYSSNNQHYFSDFCMLAGKLATYLVHFVNLYRGCGLSSTALASGHIRILGEGSGRDVLMKSRFKCRGSGDLRHFSLRKRQLKLHFKKLLLTFVVCCCRRM